MTPLSGVEIKFEHMDYLKRYADNALLRNYIRIFSVDILVKGSGILLLPLYLRLMTQDEYGLYGYLIAIISTFSLVFNLGIYAAQSKLYHDFPEEQRGSVIFTLNALLLLFIAGLMAGILLFKIDYPLVEFLFKGSLDYEQYRPAILLGVLVSVYALMLINYFLTSEDIRKVQLFNLTRAILINGVVLGVLWLFPGGDHTLMRIQYSNLIEGIIILSFSFFYIKKMRVRFDGKIATRALTISLPILVSAIIGIFANLSDRYFIEKYGTLRELSIYNLGMTFASIIPFAFASFQNIWLPQLLKEKDPSLNRARSKKMIVRLAIGFALLSACIIIALKLMLWTGIIDLKYDSIMMLLPIVLTTAVVTSLTGMYSNQLIYMEKLYIIIVVGIPAALFGIVINVWLVPLYGIYGAAFASLAVNLFFLISYALVTRVFHKRNIEAY